MTMRTGTESSSLTDCWTPTSESRQGPHGDDRAAVHGNEGQIMRFGTVVNKGNPCVEPCDDGGSFFRAVIDVVAGHRRFQHEKNTALSQEFQACCRAVPEFFEATTQHRHIKSIHEGGWSVLTRKVGQTPRAGLGGVFLDVSHNDARNAFHVVPLDDAIENDGEAVALLHHVNELRRVHVFPAPCVEQPRSRVTNGRSDFSHLTRLKGDHDVTKPPYYGHRWDVQPHVTHLHADVRCDLGSLTAEVLPSTKRRPKRFFGRGCGRVAGHATRSEEDGLNPSLRPMG